MNSPVYYRDANGELWMEQYSNGLHYFRCLTSELPSQAYDSVPSDMVVDPNPFGLVGED